MATDYIQEVIEEAKDILDSGVELCPVHVKKEHQDTVLMIASMVCLDKRQQDRHNKLKARIIRLEQLICAGGSGKTEEFLPGLEPPETPVEKHTKELVRKPTKSGRTRTIAPAADISLTIKSVLDGALMHAMLHPLTIKQKSDLAKRIGVSRHSIVRWNNGDKPHTTTLVKVAEALGYQGRAELRIAGKRVRMPFPEMFTEGLLVQAIRKYQAYGPTELGRRLGGLKCGTICCWQSGKALPSMDHLKELVRMFVTNGAIKFYRK